MKFLSSCYHIVLDTLYDSMVLFSVVTNNGKDVCVQLTKEKI